MSGKAPPKGPRALLGTHHPLSHPLFQQQQQPSSSSTSPTSQHRIPNNYHHPFPKSQAASSSSAPLGGGQGSNGPALPRTGLNPSSSSSTPSASSRIGATPPTGPRSLQNHPYPRGPPPIAHRDKHGLTNGHTGASSSNGNSFAINGLQANRYPVSIKGKSRENTGGNYSWNPQSHPSASPVKTENVFGNGPSTSKAASPPSPAVVTQSGELKQDRAAVHIAMQPRRDRASSAVEPPPPPNYDPPPPPPPSQPPPPAPSSGPCPPVFSPPPLPPPTNEDPESSTSARLSSEPTERSPSPFIIVPPSIIILDLPRPDSRQESISNHNISPPPQLQSSLTPPRPRSPSPPPSQIFKIPDWPPPKSEYPDDLRSFKVLFDPVVDTFSSSIASPAFVAQTYPHIHPPTYYRQLIEHVRKHAPNPFVLQERIRGKGKGKEMLYRMEGEVIEVEDGIKEEEPSIRDPRKDPSIRKSVLLRSTKTELIETKYEFDINSTGPAPPASVLITNVSPLTPNTHLRRNFSQHGNLISFESQIDKENGSALGILYIKYSTHEEAKRCVERENGRKGGIVGAGAPSKHAGDVEEWKVVFDGEGTKLKAVIKELEERKKRERDEKKRGSGLGLGLNGSSAGMAPTPLNTSIANGGAETPLSSVQSPAPRKPGPGLGGSSALPQGQGSKPTTNNPSNLNNNAASSSSSHRPSNNHSNARNTSTSHPNANSSSLPSKPSEDVTIPEPKPIDALEKAKAKARELQLKPSNPLPTSAPPPSSIIKSKYGPTSRSRKYQTALPLSRSPSPSSDTHPSELSNALRAPPKSAADREKDHLEVLKALAENGNDHVKIQGGVQLVATVREEEVKMFFDGYTIDKILRDHTGLYITFPKPSIAQRATSLLGSKQLGFQAITLTHHPPPPFMATLSRTHWTEAELLRGAQAQIILELRSLLEKDIKDRIIGQDLKRVVNEEKTRNTSALSKFGAVEKKGGLKGLSFKFKKVKENAEAVATAELEKEAEEDGEDEEEEDETVVEKRPKKKRKVELTRKTKKVDEEDVESEEEDDVDLVRLAAFEEQVAAAVGRKREVSKNEVDEEPLKKKAKLEISKSKKSPAGKKSKKAITAARVSRTSEPIEEDVEIIFNDLEVQSPALAHVHPDFAFDSSLSPSISPSPVLVAAPVPLPAKQRPPAKRKIAARPRLPTPTPPSPPPDPVEIGLCEDDEDVFFARLALSGCIPIPESDETSAPPPSSLLDVALPSFRKHLTGSARTEGYYRTTHAEKAAYVAQYQARTASIPSNSNTTIVVDDPHPQHITSSRSNRANARRRAQGLEEINQVQRAVALSKGEALGTGTGGELTFKFNQLQTRKKRLAFAKSPIHDWGLHAMEKISRGEMVIEYVGEVIRAQVADKREKAYERQGIGSSYLFRIDEDLVVDATKKGNLGRLINHSCDPNCTAKIITISGEKKIVIYAKRDIEVSEEITYDYHFPFEQDKIPCLCGSAKCRGFLN